MNDGSTCPPGFFTGTVTDMWLESKGDDPNFLAAHFNVDLENGETVECGHILTGEHGDMNKEIVGRTLDTTDWFDFGADEMLANAKGKTVQVSVKHKAKRDGGHWVNAYISGGKAASERVEPDDIKARLARLKNDENPF